MKSVLNSVWTGSDRALLQAVIPFYWHGPGVPAILDTTFGRGVFWPADFAGTAIDVAPSRPGVVAMDNRALAFQDRSFDVIVYDPPHITDSSPRGRYADRFGTAAARGLTIADQFPAFLGEAARVVRPEGLVLAKVADMVHSARAQWQHVAFMRDAEAAGLTVCDLIVKVRRQPTSDSKWKRQLHARKQHCFWIVARRGRC